MTTPINVSGGQRTPSVLTVKSKKGIEALCSPGVIGKKINIANLLEVKSNVDVITKTVNHYLSIEFSLFIRYANNPISHAISNEFGVADYLGNFIVSNGFWFPINVLVLHKRPHQSISVNPIKRTPVYVRENINRKVYGGQM
ncbi:hypothetical protein L1O59_005263 [Salmonella enterica]|nr:hypothetical protein [Salmonella enterica]ECD6162112.1 hypothetical protein [Salmonella enterica subsp. enterica]ECU7994714.1 hypothetical protein [Salmonella enterica subsp. enterica serovar Toucra]EDH5873459.1 hypothetical protein [Salmonella enterica subsp. enterica serovar Oranienburg]EAW3043780.1 hypothetical protein [Salmonella enterica]